MADLVGLPAGEVISEAVPWGAPSDLSIEVEGHSVIEIAVAGEPQAIDSKEWGSTAHLADARRPAS